MTDAARAFRGFRFPAEVILWAVTRENAKDVAAMADADPAFHAR